ncbi:hypothetical protein BDR04DRAFT_362175 [Suillus decipiens]|nr:hypothetical protein BDR04DRAFT_362175 [Suillus decipiens]
MVSSHSCPLFVCGSHSWPCSVWSPSGVRSHPFPLWIFLLGISNRILPMSLQPLTPAWCLQLLPPARFLYPPVEFGFYCSECRCSGSIILIPIRHTEK